MKPEVRKKFHGGQKKKERITGRERGSDFANCDGLTAILRFRGRRVKCSGGSIEGDPWVGAGKKDATREEEEAGRPKIRGRGMSVVGIPARGGRAGGGGGHVLGKSSSTAP